MLENRSVSKCVINQLGKIKIDYFRELVIQRRVLLREGKNRFFALFALHWGVMLVEQLKM